ncbi:MAG: YggT family protein [Fusobacteriaceae bacterium]|jgi:YggT family protein|nr:YggT family protein [Fusobacteriaceae bacterium]
MNIRYILVLILSKVVKLVDLVLLARCLMSWLPYRYRQSALGRILYDITEPFLYPIRKYLPAMGIDFSPIILMFFVEFVVKILIRILYF